MGSSNKSSKESSNGEHTLNGNYMNKEIYNQVLDQVWDQVRNQVWNQVRESLH